MINAWGQEIIPFNYGEINSDISSTCDNYGYRSIKRIPYPFY